MDNREFLTNYSKLTFLDKIKDSLNKCDKFYFSVSFIKEAGLNLILEDIKNSLKRGVNGKIITSTYQNFTDGTSLDIFVDLMNHFSKQFEARLDDNCFGDNGFHTKGYIFEYKKHFEIIIGSSNVTRFALLKNIEWNVAILVKDSDDIIEKVLNEFSHLWNKTKILNNELITQYKAKLEYILEKWDMDFYLGDMISPNIMQQKALKEIRRYRDIGVRRALIIAATGSGKTYLAAFDAKNFDAKHLLFVVHRDTIINNAIKSFSNIFKDSVTYGKFIGDSKEIDKDFIFASNILLSKNLSMFDPNEFDYIIIDEVHHAAAETYKKIINYFKPQFLLGLTATPERTDNESVFELFGNNVPYELRLRDALLNDLVVPFKYYGIKDDNVDYSSMPDARKMISHFATENRCEFISDNIKKFGYSGSKLKAIGFCKDVTHAQIMSKNMNDLGYTTCTLYGNSSTKDRITAFSKLQNDNDPLEIIFTVDILNEGIDIPGINMVLFLRPTESSIIFIQQLGRGLRKYIDKTYLTVLDFIGNNYNRSVQIAMALCSLSANSVLNKKFINETIRNDFKNLDLPIEIHLDKFAKDEILKQIELTNFNSKVFLDQDYKNFKKLLNNEIPKHIDYLEIEGAPDLLKYISKYNSYYEYLLTIEGYYINFDEEQRKFIKKVSSYLPLIRPYEFLIIKYLLDNEVAIIDDLLCYVNEQDFYLDVCSLKHAINNLQNNYYSTLEMENMFTLVNYSNNKYHLNINKIDEIFIQYIKDVVNYGLQKYREEFGYTTDNLTIYKNYTRIQFLQAICCNTMTFREGIKYYNGDLYLFIDLNKDDKKEEWLLYNDKFINANIMQWESSTSTTLENKKGLDLINKKHAKVFVRKYKKEDGLTLPYVYIGEGELTNPRKSNNIKESLLFDIILINKLPNDLIFELGINSLQH